MHRLCTVALTVCIAFNLSGCAGDRTRLPCEQDSLCARYALTADFPILDPHIAALPEAGMIFRQIYDTLVYRDTRTKEFLPGLAQYWETSPDGLIYTFHLRDDVRFHDGTPFSAASVAANLHRIMDPAYVSRRARGLLGPFSHYEILDARTIRLYLHSPFAPLLDSLAQPFLGIASEHALASYDSLRYQFHQSGSGPFVLEKYLPGDRIVLRRFDHYTTEAGIYSSLIGGEVQRVEFYIAEGQYATSQQVLSESFDILDEVAPKTAANLAGNSRIQVVPIEIPGQTVQLLFNTRREHVNDVDVRRALLLATNRVAIANNIYANYSPVAWAPLSIATGYAHTGFVNELAFDLGLAKEILEQTGYQDSDEDGILDRDGVPLRLSIVIPPWGQLPEVAEFIREQWRQIGVQLEIDSVPGFVRLVEKIQAGENDLVAIETYGLDPAILGSIFSNQALYTRSRMEDEALNDLLLKAVETQDPSSRRSQYYEIQAYLMTNALILPIRENVRLRLVRSNVRDLRFDAYGFYPLLFNLRLDGS
ncbi:MAG: ABC transporter substrate-binding protein [Chloroflexi bacterium]|nr:ABC transporter substrate-binding protein [Chloroflexota bacterium]